MASYAGLTMQGELVKVHESAFLIQSVQNNFNHKIFLFGVGGLVVAIALSWLVAERYARPLVRLTEQTRRVASGDLTVSPLLIRSHDELGITAENFNQMVDELRNLMLQVNQSSANLSANSEQLAASAEETRLATGQIAAVVHEIAAGSELQVSHIEAGNKMIDELSDTIDHIARNAEYVSKNATQASGFAESGGSVIEKTVTQMQQISDKISQLTHVVRLLGERSNGIGAVVDTITQISSQTNLLALNAAIEAARAGEQGKGFAVVAIEVRQLAEQSAKAAKKIASELTMVQTDIKNAVRFAEEGTDVVKTGIEVVDEAGGSFKQIRSSVEQVASDIRDVSLAAKRMTESTILTDAIRSISKVAVNNAQGTHRAIAVTEEQKAAMKEVAVAARTLSEMAEQLQLAVGSFKM